MKVVIDTNILVSAALKNKVPEEVILCVAFNLDYTWLVSTEIIEEYQSVLNRKKLNINPDRCKRFLQYVQDLTTLIVVNNTIEFERDRKDAKFLACATAGKADLLITGDKDFSEAQTLVATKIILVSQFKEVYLGSSNPEIG
jgi:putative PIN family toxin of toxin-antitoxin system